MCFLSLSVWASRLVSPKPDEGGSPRLAGKKTGLSPGWTELQGHQPSRRFGPATACGRPATAKTGLRRLPDQLRRLFSDLRRIADELRRASDDLRRPLDDLRRPFSTCDGLRTTCDAYFSSCDGEKPGFLAVLPVGGGQKATVEAKST